MARRPFLFLILAATALLGGCGSWVGEDRSYDMQQEWHQFSHFDWVRSAGEISGFHETFPSAADKERMNEEKICEHPNSQERVVTQDGISDAVVYRRCPLAPYSNDGGSRLGNRPDGLGKVVD